MSASGTRLRVLVVDQGPGVWGAQAVLLRLVSPLAACGIDLVLATSPSTDLARVWRERGHELRDIDLPLDRSVRVHGATGRVSVTAMVREAAQMIRAVGRIRAAARAADADVIWANGHAVHLEAALAGRIVRVPTVVQLHERIPYLFGRLVRSAAVVISAKTMAVSNAVFENLPRAVARRVEVIQNGIDVEGFRPAPADPAVRAALGAGPDDVLVVAMSRIDPEKRVEDLLRAVASLPKELPWRLAVVGTTSGFPEYAEAMRACGAELLGERVVFAGRRDDAALVLHAADVLLHAGELEGLPLVVLEAQACALPVVAYALGGVPESMVHRVTGLLARPRDVADLTQCLRTLVEDAATRERLGRAGRSYVEEHHRIANQAARTAALIRTLVNHPQEP